MRPCLLIVPALVGLSSAGFGSAAQICDPRFPITSPCPGIAQRAAEVVNALARSAGAAVNMSQQIETARRRFFRSYPNGPDRAAAEEAFSSLLDQKDAYYFYLTFYPSRPGPSAANTAHNLDLVLTLGNQIDGGIRPFASPEFRNWTELFHRKMRRKAPASLNELASSYAEAFGETRYAHEIYRLARNWAEFAVSGYNLTDDAKTWVADLLILDHPWYGPDEDPDRMTKAAEYYRTLETIFGGDAVVRAARHAMAATKNRQPPRYRDFFAALGGASTRNDAIIVLLGESYRHGTSELRNAQTTFQKYVAEYGEPAVREAVNRVRSTPRDASGNIEDIRVLHISHNDPQHALEDLLANRKVAVSTGSSANTVENPEYALWSRVKPGTVVSYASKDPRWIHVRTDKLASLGGEGATIVRTERRFKYENQVLQFDHNEQLEKSIYARIAKSDLDKELRPSSWDSLKLTEDSGTQELTVNGRAYQCRWKKISTPARYQGVNSVTTWISDDVPGGVVRVVAVIEGGESEELL